MNIAIAERLHPFSHRPGVRCLLPCSQWQVEVFPALLKFQSLAHPELKMQVGLTVAGPITGFTAEVDLEKGCVRVFGMTQKGYLRYQMSWQHDGIALVFEKVPEGGVDVHHQVTHTVQEKQTLLLGVKAELPPYRAAHERLSLGMHKAQDWDLICRRLDLKEIFPLWLRAGQLTPPQTGALIPVGTLRLLGQLQEAIAKAHTQDICPLFSLLFQTGFSGIATPRLSDEAFQGILPVEEIPSTASALPILSLGGALIRSLFFQEVEGGWKVLSCLPSEFPAGRLIGLCTEKGEAVTLEWSKHRLKKMVIRTAQESDVFLQFPSSIRSCRLRGALAHQGKTLTVNEGRAQLQFKEKQTLFLDRFEK